MNEEHILETDRQVSCNGGRREISNPETKGASVEDGEGVGESEDGADLG